MPPRHAERVLDRSVGDAAAPRPQFWDKRQLLAVFAAIRLKAFLERRADAKLVRRPAESYQLGEVGAVAVYVGVGWHGCLVGGCF